MSKIRWFWKSDKITLFDRKNRKLIALSYTTFWLENSKWGVLVQNSYCWYVCSCLYRSFPFHLQQLPSILSTWVWSTEQSLKWEMSAKRVHKLCILLSITSHFAYCKWCIGMAPKLHTCIYFWPYCQISQALHFICHFTFIVDQIKVWGYFGKLILGDQKQAF